MMTNTMYFMKSIATITVCSIVAYFEPIGAKLMVITAAFVLDLFLGSVTSIGLDKEKFKMYKFLIALGIYISYLACIAFVYFIGEKMQDIKQADYAIVTLTYVFLYCYALNMLKNLKRLFPRNLAFAILHYLLNFEFFKRFPNLKEHLEKQNNSNPKTKENG